MSSVTFNQQNRAYIAIGLTLFAAGSAPFFIRYAQLAGVPSLSIIVYRLVLGTLIITPYMLRHHTGTLKRMDQRDWVLAIGAGTFHALGLILLFFSLEYTSILVNGVLRRTSPLWSILMELFFLGAVFKRSMWWGLGIAMLGSVLIVFGTAGAIEPGSRPVFGGLLSLANAFTLSVYLIIGRSLRNKLPFMAYSWVLFASATVVSLIVALIVGVPFSGFTIEGYFWTIMIVFFAQIIGHMGANFAVRSITATYLAILMQAGVIVAAIFAFFLFGEIPSPLQIIGSVVLLGGIYWVSR